MLNIALFGPPGAGKGTQAAFLLQEHHLIHLAPGDIFRDHIARKTPLGLQVKACITQGELASDELVISLVQETLASYQDSSPKGFLLDGYPRTKGQALALDEQLDVDAVLFLDVPEEPLVKRLLGRAQEAHREDDAFPERIHHRLEVYKAATLPITAYYAKQGKLIRIDGSPGVEEVREAIQKALADYLPQA